MTVQLTPDWATELTKVFSRKGTIDNLIKKWNEYKYLPLTPPAGYETGAKVFLTYLCANLQQFLTMLLLIKDMGYMVDKSGDEYFKLYYKLTDQPVIKPQFELFDKPTVQPAFSPFGPSFEPTQFSFFDEPVLTKPAPYSPPFNHSPVKSPMPTAPLFGLNMSDGDGTNSARNDPLPAAPTVHSSYGCIIANNQITEGIELPKRVEDEHIAGPFENKCSSCLKHAVNIVFIPCAHMCSCYSCALGLVTGSKRCPICKLEIKLMVNPIVVKK